MKKLEELSMQQCGRKMEMGQIFGAASYLGIWFNDVEIKYIETKMMTHKLYRVLSGKMSGNDFITPYQYQAIEIWLQNFLSDPNLPLGVRAFIHYYLGAHHGDIRCSGEKEYAEYMQHSFLTELWMEKCR